MRYFCAAATRCKDILQFLALARFVEISVVSLDRRKMLPPRWFAVVSPARPGSCCYLSQQPVEGVLESVARAIAAGDDSAGALSAAAQCACLARHAAPGVAASWD